MAQYAPQVPSQAARYGAGQDALPSLLRPAPLPGFDAASGVVHPFVPGHRLNGRVSREETLLVPPPHHSGQPDEPSFAFDPSSPARAQARLENARAAVSLRISPLGRWGGGGGMHDAEVLHPHLPPYAERMSLAAHSMDARAHMALSVGGQHAAMHSCPLFVERPDSVIEYNVDVVAADGGGGGGSAAAECRGRGRPTRPSPLGAAGASRADGTRHWTTPGTAAARSKSAAWTANLHILRNRPSKIHARDDLGRPLHSAPPTTLSCPFSKIPSNIQHRR